MLLKDIKEGVVVDHNSELGVIKSVIRDSNENPIKFSIVFNNNDIASIEKTRMGRDYFYDYTKNLIQVNTPFKVGDTVYGNTYPGKVKDITIKNDTIVYLVCCVIIGDTYFSETELAPRNTKPVTVIPWSQTTFIKDTMKQLTEEYQKHIEKHKRINREYSLQEFLHYALSHTPPLPQKEKEAMVDRKKKHYLVICIGNNVPNRVFETYAECVSFIESRIKEDPHREFVIYEALQTVSVKQPALDIKEL